MSYSEKPKKDITTGTAIKNRATVDFEVGIPPAPQNTPEVFNTIYADPPVSRILSVTSLQDPSEFLDKWSGSDVGSGIIDYSIYWSKDGGNFTKLFSNISDTFSVTKITDPGEYRFYSISRDNAGNMEKAPVSFDISILITAVEDKVLVSEKKTLMLSSHPNPFNNNTEITYDLPDNGIVILQLFDIHGNLVEILINTYQPAGANTYQLNNRTLPAGMYFVKLIYTNSKECIIQLIKIIRSDL